MEIKAESELILSAEAIKHPKLGNYCRKIYEVGLMNVLEIHLFRRDGPRLFLNLLSPIHFFYAFNEIGISLPLTVIVSFKLLQPHQVLLRPLSFNLTVILAHFNLEQRISDINAAVLKTIVARNHLNQEVAHGRWVVH
jgi:hypothetical protein